MTISLVQSGGQSITFDTEEVSAITVTKGSGVTLRPLVDQDSDQAETIVLEGANTRITIRGNVYKADYTACQARYAALTGLITGSIDTPLAVFTMPLLASSINTIIESVEISMDANALPVGHFGFSINLIQSRGML